MSSLQRNIIIGLKMKIIITESKLERAVINWLSDNFGDLEPYETEDRPNFILYKKGKQVIFEYNKKSGDVFINYDEIWSFLSSFFSMNYKQIQNIMERWIEEHYNLEVMYLDYHFL